LGAVENIFGHWGFINKQNHFVIEYQYEDAMPFQGGIAAVKKDGKWGFITKSNRFVVKPTYDDVLDTKFYGNAQGKAKVRNKDSTYFVNAKGIKLEE
jgi:WG containing repeat